VQSADLETTLRGLLASAPQQVVSAYLFGSAARGTAGPRSDIDLGVLLAARPRATLEDRMLAYESSLGRELARPLQLVVLNDAPADLLHRVLRDGRLLLDRDRAARLRFEVRARNEYFDILPVLQRYRAAALRKARAAR
jgi:predicted nucleotidyltransferase